MCSPPGARSVRTIARRASGSGSFQRATYRSAKFRGLTTATSPAEASGHAGEAVAGMNVTSHAGHPWVLPRSGQYQGRNRQWLRCRPSQLNSSSWYLRDFGVGAVWLWSLCSKASVRWTPAGSPHRGEDFTDLGLAPPPVACAISLLLSEAEPSASTPLDRHRLVLIRALQQFGAGPRGSDAPPFTKVLDTTRQSPEPLPGFHARRRGQKADDRQLCGSLPVTRTSA